jgi:hypothetical protein
MSYLDMLRTLDEDGDSSEMPKSPTVETVETPSKPSIDGLDGSPSGTFQKITPPEPPPDLTDDERADLREALDERAAIMEFDGGLPRPEAETQAVRLMRVYRVRVAMGENEPDRWTVMLAPGCDLPEAQHAAALQFGPERVRELVEVQR